MVDEALVAWPRRMHWKAADFPKSVVSLAAFAMDVVPITNGMQEESWAVAARGDLDQTGRLSPEPPGR